VAYTGPVRRWDLFWVDLEPYGGREQGGEQRPALVVSNDGVNATLDAVTVLPATTCEGRQRNVYPFEVVLAAGTIAPQQLSLVMPQQIRTISRKRLRAKIGQVTDASQQAAIENRLLEHLGIQFEAEGLERM
jgi:mRNA-degrading endonuclease toxin of MazEF toxin-antitoxin module